MLQQTPSKTIRALTLLGAFLILTGSSLSFAETEHTLLIADFSAEDNINNLGGGYGTWNQDPNDATQGCYYFSEPEDFESEDSGFSARLDYDVQSDRPAFNGFWLDLKGTDATDYDSLTFWVRGARAGNFTRAFKIELKDKKGKKAVYPVQDIRSEWTKVEIDMKASRSDVDWTNLNQLVIVFDDILATHREGTIFVDQIAFEKKHF